MKKYNITVNGKKYEVLVEETDETPGSIAEAPAALATSVPKAKEQSSKAEPSSELKNDEAPIEGGETIECPMPGTILEVNVKPGDIVKRGDVLFILEAMKMGNEIMAPRDGKIAKVGVSKGASANTGDMLAVLV